MIDYRSREKRIADTLALGRRPVAVAFRETPPGGVPRFTGSAPSGCSFWRRTLATEQPAVSRSPAGGSHRLPTAG